jgi:hypothetical protein
MATERSSRASADDFIVTVTVQSGKIQVPGGKKNLLSTFPRGPAVWLLENEDGENYRVVIDPAKFVHKKTGKPGHPFPHGDKLDAFLPAHGQSAITATIKDYKPVFPDEYKYTIDLNDETGSPVDSLDPDLDVVDPGSIRGEKR